MIEIKERNKMPHLDREEVTALLTFSGAVPNRQDVRKELASAAKAKEDMVVVRQIDPWFGEMKADVHAAIYDNEDSMKKIEGQYMHDRHAVKKEAVEASDEVSEEAPAEKAAGGEAQAEEKETAESEEKKEEAEEEAPKKNEEEEPAEEPENDAEEAAEKEEEEAPAEPEERKAEEKE